MGQGAARRVLAVAAPGGTASGLPRRRAGFARIVRLDRLGDDAEDSVAARLAAVEAASRAGADWLMLMAPGESLTEDALVLAWPALGLYDAIFGAAHVDGVEEPVAKLSRLAFDGRERLPHALLNWWVPASHLVRRSDPLRAIIVTAGASAYRSCACPVPTHLIRHICHVRSCRLAAGKRSAS